MLTIFNKSEATSVRGREKIVNIVSPGTYEEV